MWFLPSNHKHERGLTLIEVLVVAPLIILLIGALVVSISNLTGDSLYTQEKNTSAYNVQSALDDIDISVRYATEFLSTTGTVTAPQGRDDTTGAPFTYNSSTDTYDTLIFSTAATDKSIYDPTRELVYKGTGGCLTSNPLYLYTTVYFVNPTSKSLYKRTILPAPGALCRTVAQKNSCATVSGTHCVTRDELLLDNVKSLKIEYLATPGSSTTTTPEQARVAVVTITRSTTGAGENVDYAGTLRASRLNVSIANETTTVENPAVTGVTNSANAGKAVFSWPASNNATGYNISYRIDGGSWQNGPQNTTQTSYTRDKLTRKQTVELRVQALTSNGNFYYTNDTVTIPGWYDCTFSGLGQWNNYGAWYGSNTFTTAGFTKTSSKIVGLKGLVKGTTLGVPICTLPVDFRPRFSGERLIFQVASGNGSNWGRIDVMPNGDIIPQAGNTEWFSLDGIMFVADDSSYTWTTRSWQNSWSNYGGTGSVLRSTTDSQGRVHVQGLGRYPGTSPNVVMTSGLSGAASGTLHIPAFSGSNAGIVQVNPSGQVLSRSSPYDYQSLQLMYRPSSLGWQNMPFSSGWTNYNNGFPTMRCHRGSDDIVVVQGLIRHPGGGNGAYIGDTSPCGRFSSGKGIGFEDRLLLSPWTSNEAPGRIDMINGVSLLSQGTADGWTALDGIHFIAD
jgi:hypothetical protein